MKAEPEKAPAARLRATAEPESENPASGSSSRWLVTGVCLFLAAITWSVFGQTLHHDYVNYDDGFYVYDNTMIKSGLTLKGLWWALTFRYPYYWQPLGLLSHMLDCQIYGLAPAGHHLTNVLLQAAVAILLFLVLRRMTGALWRSAFVAAVFAIHPLRVESVAWIAERKDMLQGLFFMLTIGAYVRYARRSWSLARYLAVVLLFALGLMSKPTLMTLPFVLLLLDYWPLKRFVSLAPPGAASGTRPAGWRSNYPVVTRLMIEKLPLFVLSAASCLQAAVGNSPAFGGNKNLSVILRVSNAVESYVAYVWQMFWPVKLAVLYPLPMKGVPMGEAVGAVILLVFISAAVFLLRQRRPYLLVGWLWYLGMLVPVIGFIQAGAQARADRYTYLPQIGLYLLLTWAAADLCAGWRHRRVVLGGGAALILLALIFCAHTQTSYWRTSESLWTHALTCTSGNFIGHNNLGEALLRQGSLDKAITQFQEALQIEPNYAESENNLGNALLQKSDADDAIAHYQRALQLKPDYTEAQNNLGNALLKKGSVTDAISRYQRALQIQPDNAEAHNNLGEALLKTGNIDEAIGHFQKALQLKPDDVETHYNLGNALLQKGRVDEAITQYQEALQLKPDDLDAGYNLGNALLQTGSVDEAIHQYQRVLEINPDFAEAHNNLGNALFQKGEVDEAIAHFQMALRLKPDHADARYNLGEALLQKGNVNEAIRQYQRALQLKPDYVAARNNLAWVLATCPQASLRNGNEAVELAQKANQLTGDGNPVVLHTLAAAYAEAGRFPDAVATAQRALQLAGTQSNTALADAIRSQLKLYQTGVPFHIH